MNSIKSIYFYLKKNKFIREIREIYHIFYLRGTSPSVQWVKRFVVEPPGQQPITNIPIAAFDESWSACARPNVTAGSTTNWESMPIPIPIGRRRWLIKFSMSMVQPIPSIMTTKVPVILISEANLRAKAVCVNPKVEFETDPLL